jgi:hypothetical protein
VNTNRHASHLSIVSLGKARAFCFALCALTMTIAASAGQPRFITFDAPGAGTGPNQGTGCFFYDCYALINNLGEITGYYLDTNNVYHGFVRSPEGQITAFEAPGADTTPQSFNGTIPNSINDAGAVTGYYLDANGNEHGFVRSREGAFTVFDVPGGSLATVGIGINVEGAVVGFYLSQNDVFLSFLRNLDGSFETWSDPGQCETTPSTGCYGAGALSINVFGIVSGGYEDNSGNFVTHGLVRSPQGLFIPYTLPAAGTGSYQGTWCPACASPVNLFGAITSYYIDANYVVHGYLRSPFGPVTTFDVPGAGPEGFGCYSDCPIGLNDWGAVTGPYPDANNVYHGFLRGPDGRVTSFDAPGANATPGSGSGTYPYSINDAGVITGSYQDSNNVYHGFILLPDDY